ncbi:MAG: DUF3866 family protein [Armatimonadetes bacterium]|nr:DUF3866 family protein [Armatimonadota bacterium]
MWGNPWVIQEVDVLVDGEIHQAINYLGLAGPVWVGDEVALNATARRLNLGTGGYDYVIANLSFFHRKSSASDSRQGTFSTQFQGGHIIKGRYTPLQQAVLTLEEQEQYAEVWERGLDGFHVLVGQLHSQIAPAAAALHLSGQRKVGYIMTDAAALPIGLSKLVHQLKQQRLVNLTITCGQAFGGNWETVTLHSALLAAKHLGGCDAAIVCQGPGNAGTGTKYGFSGIEQAQNLDIVSALGGTAIAIVRMSSADARERHQGISHHTRTTLELAHSRCLVPLPAGTEAAGLPNKHDVRRVEGAQAALDLLAEKNIRVTTMGRTPAEDPAFFLAAAAAGMV